MIFPLDTVIVVYQLYVANTEPPTTTYLYEFFEDSLKLNHVA